METFSTSQQPDNESLSRKQVVDQRAKRPAISLKRLFPSISIISCYGSRREPSNNTNADVSVDMQADNKVEAYEPLGFIPEDEESEKSFYNSKEIIPLRQFLRYTITPRESRKFGRQRMLKPARAIYEVEWEKDQWLQLDNSTNKYIEDLRAKGFSKIAIRNDTCLKKHLSYDNPSPMDILLELSLEPGQSKENNREKRRRSRPICCHQPSTFSIRRTQWWQTVYEIGEAHLPKWVDPDLCCNAVMMNAPSVMAVMANASQSSCYFNQLKFPDTPNISNNSSLSQLPLESPSTPPSQNSSWPVKPLKYATPPILSNTLVQASN